MKDRKKIEETTGKNVLFHRVAIITADENDRYSTKLYRPVRLRALASAAVYLAVTSLGHEYSASPASSSASTRSPSQTSPVACNTTTSYVACNTATSYVACNTATSYVTCNTATSYVHGRQLIQIFAGSYTRNMMTSMIHSLVNAIF